MISTVVEDTTTHKRLLIEDYIAGPITRMHAGHSQMTRGEEERGHGGETEEIFAILIYIIFE